jgi:hypothetical protein
MARELRRHLMSRRRPWQGSSAGGKVRGARGGQRQDGGIIYCLPYFTLEVYDLHSITLGFLFCLTLPCQFYGIPF